MTKRLVVAAATAIFAAGVAISVPAFSQQETSTLTVSDADKAKIGQIVREYLLENPEILEEVQVALQNKREEEQKLVQRETIENSNSTIFSLASDPVIGNPAAKTAIVEFFDYNCGYCKRALGDMTAMVEADPDLKFILKEFPILGPDSQKAHVVASAFYRLMPEMYSEFHQRLLNGPGRADEDTAIKLALDLGADEEKLRAEMGSAAILEGFSETYEIANKLGITGTPSYIVGDEVVFGALGQKVLSQKVANVRKCQKATC